MYQFLTQAIGFLATALQVGSFQFKSSRRLIFVQLCANTAFLVHLLMLGAYSGCVNVLFSCIRNLLLRHFSFHSDFTQFLAKMHMPTPFAIDYVQIVRYNNEEQKRPLRA